MSEIEIDDDIDSVNQSDNFDDSIRDTIEDTVRSTLGDELPDGISFGIKISGPPRKGWDYYTKPKFQPGQYVVHRSFDDEKCETTVWAMKVTGLGKHLNTYTVKKSGCRDERIVNGEDIKLAPDDAKWESYAEKNNPFNVPGLKISCPSNDYGKKIR